jgi:hypothetical protein
MGKMALGALFVVAMAWACGGPQEQGGPGSTCFRDDECEYGLVCAAVGDAERTCTNDVSALIEQYVPEGVPMIPTPGAGGTAAGGAPAAAGTPSGAGAPSNGGGAGTPASAGTPSTAGAPPQSNGGTGSSEPSAGAPAEATAGNG